MPPTGKVKTEVINYLREHRTPERLRKMAEDLRNGNEELRPLSDSDFRAIVQPMIVTGRLSYAPGLKIKLGRGKE